MKSLEAKIAEMQVLTGFDLLLDLLAQPVDPSRKRNLVSQMPPKDSISCCRVVEISDFSRWKKWIFVLSWNLLGNHGIT